MTTPIEQPPPSRDEWWPAWLLAVTLCTFIGCQPSPKPTPFDPCPSSVTDQHQPNRIQGVSDCYVCTLARNCTTQSNHYCCRDTSCSECDDTPVPGIFGDKHRPLDAGVRP